MQIINHQKKIQRGGYGTLIPPMSAPLVSMQYGYGYRHNIWLHEMCRALRRNAVHLSPYQYSQVFFFWPGRHCARDFIYFISLAIIAILIFIVIYIIIMTRCQLVVKCQYRWINVSVGIGNIGIKIKYKYYQRDRCSL